MRHDGAYTPDVCHRTARITPRGAPQRDNCGAAGCLRQLTAMGPTPCGLRCAVPSSAVHNHRQRRLMAPLAGIRPNAHEAEFCDPCL